MVSRDKPRHKQTRRQLLVSLGAGTVALRVTHAPAQQGTERIDRTMESIHQEVDFKAPRERLYAALTDGSQFHKVTLLSAAMQSGMAKDTQPTEISREPGGAFALFGGLIVGRHIELVSNERIVQAWRAVEWDPGAYSIVRFELLERRGGTRLLFEHTGFPKGQAQHLAEGWKVNYWLPLEKFLA